MTAGIVTAALLIHVLWTSWMDDDGLDSLGSFLMGFIGMVMAWTGFGIGLVIHLLR
jgi:hypothetical protein